MKFSKFPFDSSIIKFKIDFVFIFCSYTLLFFQGVIHMEAPAAGAMVRAKLKFKVYKKNIYISYHADDARPSW